VQRWHLVLSKKRPCAHLAPLARDVVENSSDVQPKAMTTGAAVAAATVVIVDLLLVAWLALVLLVRRRDEARVRDGFVLSVLHVTHRHRLLVAVGRGEDVPADVAARWRELEVIGVTVSMASPTGAGSTGGGLPAAGDSVAVTDALSLAFGGTGAMDRVVAVVPGGLKVLLVLSPFRPAAPQSLDAASDGLDVLVAGALEARLLDALAWTASWPPGRVRATVVEKDGDYLIDRLLLEDKAVALWISPTHPALRRLSRAQVTVVTYDEGTALDPTRLGLAAPLARTSTHDTRLLAPASRGTRRFVTLLASPTLLFASARVDANPLLPPLLRATVRAAPGSARARDGSASAAVADLNLVAMHLPVTATTAAWLKARNAEAAVRLRRAGGDDGDDANGPPLSTSEIPDAAILEQLLQQPEGLAPVVRLTPAGPVAGRLVRVAPDGAQAVFAPASRWIGGVRLRPGDRVTLSAQPAAAENGAYVAATEPGGGPLRLFTSLDMPYDAVTFVSGTSRDAATALRVSAAAVAARWPDVPLAPGDRLWLSNVAQLATVTAVGSDGGGGGGGGGDEITLRLTDLRPDAVLSDKFGATATCVTDPTAHVQQLCEWGGDQGGALGDAPGSGVWDHRCVADADCPFFMANRTYPNTRGGCSDNGLCEMPVGVTRVGFRKFTGEPACHGCAPPGPGRTMAQCCEARRAAVGAPTPNYAFPPPERAGVSKAASGV
jgi:hypothetical protein